MVDAARIGAGPGHDYGGLVLAGQSGHFVIIDAACFLAHAVGNDLKQATREVHRAAVGQMPAVGEIHAQDHVAGLEAGEIGGHIGLGTGMGLHVDVAATEELLGPVLGQGFGDVHVFAAAVIALAGIAFGIFVGQHAALGFAHGGRNKVLRGDQFQFAHLPVGFQNDGPGQLRILKQNFVHERLSFAYGFPRKSVNTGRETDAPRRAAEARRNRVCAADLAVN